MRIPQRPPDWSEIMGGTSPEELGATLNRMITDPEVAQLVRSANESYLHWHKFRFRPMPAGLTPKWGWAAVQLGRQSQFQRLPLTAAGADSLKYWVPPQHHEW